jgi:hypothetical protein
MKRFVLSLPFVSLLLFTCQIGFAQTQTSTQPVRDPQAAGLLQRSLSALIGNNALTDVTLSGTGTRTAGSDTESGTATLRATSSGQSRVDFAFGSGQRSEARDASVMPPTGEWVAPNASITPIAQHNLLTEPAWFFPAFVLARVLSNPNYSISSIDQETKLGVVVDHFKVFQQVTIPGDTSNSFQSLTRMDFYLDPSSLLPLAIDVNTHPDNNAGLNIPVEFQYSSYQPVQGANVPFHVQQLVNNVVVLDIEISATNFNTGLTNAIFSLQ